MDTKKFKHIYGPVFSWRLGVSLGIDPLGGKEKICNLDCVYCQLGAGKGLSQERKVYVPATAIVDEIKALPAGERIDYYTFSGLGEPTLALNLGEMIKAVRECSQGKIAVITNSVLLSLADVRAEVALADFVLAKIDAVDQKSFVAVNQAAPDADFRQIFAGIKSFRQQYHGKLALQIMFIAANRHLAKQMAETVADIGADEIELNTPLRPCAVEPLSAEEMTAIKESFRGMPAATVYERERKTISPLNKIDTTRRHGQYDKTK